MKGIWAAALNPFKKDYSFDSEGFKQNINHWIEDLEIDGLFICGKQGEFFSMSIEERKDNSRIENSEIPRATDSPSSLLQALYLAKIELSLGLQREMRLKLKKWNKWKIESRTGLESTVELARDREI